MTPNQLVEKKIKALFLEWAKEYTSLDTTHYAGYWLSDSAAVAFYAFQAGYWATLPQPLKQEEAT